MTFITALLWIIPIIVILSILVYGYVIVMSVGVKFLWVVKNCFSKKSKAPCMEEIKQIFTEDLFLTQQKYKNRSLLKMGFGLFFIVHLLFFLVSYFTYVNDDTKYHKAKAYYAVGAIPHVYSVVLGHITTPLHPAFLGLNLPITKIKEILFEKGVEYIPKDDAERELWEYEWFYYPYVIRAEGMWGRYVGKVGSGDKAFGEEVYLHYANKLNRLYEIMEALNSKSLADNKKQLEAKISFALMARYYFLEKLALAPYDEYVMSMTKSPSLYLRTNAEMKKRSRKIALWLKQTREELFNSQEFTNYKEAHPRKATLAEIRLFGTLIWYFENNLMIDIHEKKFSCESEAVLEYVKSRKTLLKGTDSSAITSRDADDIYNASVNNIQSEFTRKVLSKYCQIEVLGVGYKVDFRETMLDEVSSVYAPEMKALNQLITPPEPKPREGNVTIKSENIIVIDNLEYENQSKYKTLNWYEAERYCKALDLDGRGWRLPKVKELEKVSTIPLCGKIFGNDCEDWGTWIDDNGDKKIRLSSKALSHFMRKEFHENIFKAEIMPTFWTAERARKYWTAPSHMRSTEVMYKISFFQGSIETDLKSKRSLNQAMCVREIDKNKLKEQ